MTVLSKQAGAAASDAAQAAGSKRSGSTAGSAVAVTIFEISVLTDGRQCKFCGCHDHDEDPVDKVLRIIRSDGKPMSMAWFAGQQKHGQKNEGFVHVSCCGVCWSAAGTIAGSSHAIRSAT